MDPDENYIVLTNETDGTHRLWLPHPTEGVQALTLTQEQVERLYDQIDALLGERL